MSPGERNEICADLLDDVTGTSLDLQSFNGGQTFGFPGGEGDQRGAFGSLLNNKTFNVLRHCIAQDTGHQLVSVSR